MSGTCDPNGKRGEEYKLLPGPGCLIDVAVSAVEKSNKQEAQLSRWDALDGGLLRFGAQYKFAST